jgi:hypothetical protein
MDMLSFRYNSSTESGTTLKILRFPIHPFLFAISPIVFLLSVNIEELMIGDALRSIIVSLVFCIIFFVVLRIVLRNWEKSAILTSLYIISFYSYGHIYTALKHLEIDGVLIGRHRFLVPVFVLCLALLTMLIRKRVKKLDVASSYLNMFAFISLILPMASIFHFLINQIPTSAYSTRVQVNGLEDSIPNLHEQLPDIYYIVVDEYARGDILRDYWNYDNSEFYEFLESCGFYVAQESSGNYMFTALSLGSSLNMNYVQDLGIKFEGEGFPGAMTSAIKQSYVRQSLENYGYSMVAIETGFFTTDIYDADYYLSLNETIYGEKRFALGFNGFESLLIHTSAAKLLLDIDILNSTWLTQRLNDPYAMKRAIVLSAFDHLMLGPDMESPIFFFAHIIAPHFPFVFGPNGEEILSSDPYTLDKSVSHSDAEVDWRRYLDQLIFVTSKLEDTINYILSKSAKPPVIIIQSDTGPSFVIDYDHPTEEGVRVKFSILNAYYLPGDCTNHLNPTISPVNSFRIVFNCYFGTTYELLENEKYWNFLKEGNPYKFAPVDDVLQELYQN